MLASAGTDNEDLHACSSGGKDNSRRFYALAGGGATAARQTRRSEALGRSGASRDLRPERWSSGRDAATEECVAFERPGFERSRLAPLLP
ncbi:hypothetical protein GLA29479_2254 [Lysobacter antibioticus]|uniref:Uncharacterized protein n=1 Tax=Lysobacter antibioticus TaxID=84531 RepID=A0A0S2DWQ7_LYSAN|nr:hypothetical protein GLA29479_2254 [Lysobacter antibioticus]ALN82432.1 hypothetical protein LA76x_4321 [Lysobacter antibioticus]